MAKIIKLTSLVNGEALYINADLIETMFETDGATYIYTLRNDEPDNHYRVKEPARRIVEKINDL